jgi:hypothetical protein
LAIRRELGVVAAAVDQNEGISRRGPDPLYLRGRRRGLHARQLDLLRWHGVSDDRGNTARRRGQRISSGPGGHTDGRRNHRDADTDRHA